TEVAHAAKRDDSVAARRRPALECPRAAGVAQWQSRSFPSLRRGFDSLHPLQPPGAFSRTLDSLVALRRKRLRAWFDSLHPLHPLKPHPSSTIPATLRVSGG